MGVGREELGAAGAEKNGSMGTGEAIPSLSHMALVGERATRPDVSELSSRERRHPGTHVMPTSPPRAIPGSIVPRRLEGISCEGRMGETAMAAKATGKAGKGTRIDVREVISTSGGDMGNAGRVDVVIKARKNASGCARREGAEEVAESSGDAEANKNVTLIRRVSTSAARTSSSIGAPKDVVKAPDEMASTVTVDGNKGHNEAIVIT